MHKPASLPQPWAPHRCSTVHLLCRGFATGSLDADAFAPRYFAQRGIEFAVAQSYSKVGGGRQYSTCGRVGAVQGSAGGVRRRGTRRRRGSAATQPRSRPPFWPPSCPISAAQLAIHLSPRGRTLPCPAPHMPPLQNLGLYAERVGAISFVLSDKEAADRVLSQLKRIARAVYSNPVRGVAQGGVLQSWRCCCPCSRCRRRRRCRLLLPHAPPSTLPHPPTHPPSSLPLPSPSTARASSARWWAARRCSQSGRGRWRR